MTWGATAPAIEPSRFSSGAETGFSENFSAAWDEQLAVEMPRSQAVDFFDAYEETRAEVKRATGQELPGLYTVTNAGMLARSLSGEPVSKEEIDSSRKFFDTDLLELSEKMEQLNTQFGTPRLKDILGKVNEDARGAYDRMQDVRGRSSGAAGFAGATAGSMTAWLAGVFGGRDPIGAATLPIGGVGRQAVTRILTEGTVQGAIAVPQQFGEGGVMEQKKRMGLEGSTDEALDNVLLAAAGGALFRGVIEGGAKALEKAKQISSLPAEDLLAQLRTTEPGSAVPLHTESPSAVESVRASDMALSREALTDHWNPAEIDTKVVSEAEIMHGPAMDAAELAIDGYPDRFRDIPLPSEREVMAYVERQAEVSPRHLQEAEAIRAAMQAAPDIQRNNPKSLEKHLGFRPVPLAEFVRDAGGIAEDGGELSTRDISNKSLPGLVRKTHDKYGNKLPGKKNNVLSERGADAVKQEVFDAGYFPEKADYDEITPSELYDAIAEDLSGKRIYTRAVDEQLEILDRELGAARAAYEASGVSPDMGVKEIAVMLAEREADDTAESIAREMVADITARMAVTPEQLQLKEEALTQLTEMADAQLAADLAELKLAAKAEDGKESGLTMAVENDKGEIVTIDITELLKDIAIDDAVVKAMNVCGVKL